MKERGASGRAMWTPHLSQRGRLLAHGNRRQSAKSEPSKRTRGKVKLIVSIEGPAIAKRILDRLEQRPNSDPAQTRHLRPSRCSAPLSEMNLNGH